MLVSSFRSLVQHWRRYALALVILFALVKVSLKVQENFPLSNFPMYGNPRPDDVDYYFLTDAKGNPLSTLDYAGITAPQIKKRLNTLLKAEKNRLKLKKSTDVPLESRKKSAQIVLEKIYEDAKNKAQSGAKIKTWPEGVQLIEGLISTTEAGFRESFRPLASLQGVVPAAAVTPAPAPAATESASAKDDAEVEVAAEVDPKSAPNNTSFGMIAAVADYLVLYGGMLVSLVVLLVAWKKLPSRMQSWLREGTGPLSVGRLEAFFIRLPLAYIFYQALTITVTYDSLPHPQGLAHWDYFHAVILWTGNPENWSKVQLWSIPLLLWYVIGWGNLIPLTMLTLIHIFQRTLYASQGAPHHGHQLVSLVFCAQTIVAWVLFVCRRFKVQSSWAKPGNETIPWIYMAVIIGCAYVITAFEKWDESDGKWIANAHYFSNQIVKTHRQNYYNDLNPVFIQGVPPAAQDTPDPANDRYRHPVPAQAHWMLMHPLLSKIFFSLGFIMEFTAFLLILNRGLAALFGVLIIAFHFLVLWLMQLTFPLNVEVVFSICVNLTGWIIWWRFRKEPAGESIPSSPDPALPNTVPAAPAA